MKLKILSENRGYKYHPVLLREDNDPGWWDTFKSWFDFTDDSNFVSKAGKAMVGHTGATVNDKGEISGITGKDAWIKTKYAQLGNFMAENPGASLGMLAGAGLLTAYFLHKKKQKREKLEERDRRIIEALQKRDMDADRKHQGAPAPGTTKQI